MERSALRRLSGNAAAILASLKRVAGAPQMLLGCHSPPRFNPVVLWVL
jgi:hypothetical protein